MNTKEVEGLERDKFEGDKLDRIFAGQKDLMQEYKTIYERHYSKMFSADCKLNSEMWAGGDHNIHTKDGNYFIREMFNATIQELGEAVQVLKNWKSWKQTEVPSDVDHFKEEVIDALHFFIEGCILAGITPDQMYDLYFKKREVNQFRQASKY